MITIVLSLWILVIISLFFIRLKVGLALFIAYYFLVPYRSIEILGLTIPWIVVYISMVASFLNEFSKKRVTIDYKPFIPFLVYFLSFFVLILFQYETPVSYQLNSWKNDFLDTMIFPFVLWNYSRIDTSSKTLFSKIFVCTIFVIVLYGLFLTTMPGINPYLMVLTDLGVTKFSEDYALAEGTGRIFGRLSSVFPHPMTFGLFLGFSFVYIYNIRNKIHFLVLWTMLILVLLCSLLCGVRSVLGGMTFVLMYYFISSKNYKSFMTFSVFAIIGYLIIIQLPDLSNYISSIGDIHYQKREVNGSSLELRLEQFDGCLKEIDNYWINGKGYNWHRYYIENKGDHPVMLAFESLIYIVLCDSGLIGVLIWIVFGILLIRANKSPNKDLYCTRNSLFVFYLSYSCITGEYRYLQFFSLFYICLLINESADNSYRTKIFNKWN